MYCVLSTAHSARRFSASLFGLVILVVHAPPVRADELEVNPATTWCVAHSGEPLDCAYEDLLACGVRAFATGGYCKRAEPPAQAAATAEPTAAPPPKRRSSARPKPATAHNDKLFKEFVRWKEAGSK